MAPSVTQTVREYEKASRQFRKEIREDRQKAIDFLLRAGILEKDKKAASGVRLVKPLR